MLPADVLARFRRGDPDAFSAVVKSFSPLIRAIVNRFWSGPFEQEEAMQEVWTHVYDQRERFDLDRVDRFRGWLAVVARNRCIHLLRKAGREAVEISDDELDQIQDLDADTARPAMNAQLREAVEAFTSGLDKPWRTFFELHFVQGLDYAEISQRLSITKIRCKYMKKVLIGRARKNRALREALGQVESD